MSEETKTVNALVGIQTIPDKAAAIQKITEDEPEYDRYLQRLSPELRLRLARAVGAVNGGLYAVAPLTCPGPDKCLFPNRCPISMISDRGEITRAPASDYPVGRQCVLERFLMRQKVIEYIEHFNVDPADPVEMAIVDELAVIDLYKHRATALLADGDKKGMGTDFMKTMITGFNPESGQESEMVIIHPVFEVVEKLEKRRERWLEKLMATRKSKADFAAKMKSDSENTLKNEIEKLRKAIDQLQVTDSTANIEEKETVTIEIE